MGVTTSGYGISPRRPSSHFTPFEHRRRQLERAFPECRYLGDIVENGQTTEAYPEGMAVPPRIVFSSGGNTQEAVERRRNKAYAALLVYDASRNTGKEVSLCIDELIQSVSRIINSEGEDGRLLHVLLRRD